MALHDFIIHHHILHRRSELTQFLEEQRDSAVRRGESDPAFGAEFKYSAHTGELVVGTVYLRIYNSNPTFPLEDPKSFVVDLLEFLQVTQFTMNFSKAKLHYD